MDLAWPQDFLTKQHDSRRISRKIAPHTRLATRIRYLLRGGRVAHGPVSTSCHSTTQCARQHCGTVCPSYFSCFLESHPRWAGCNSRAFSRRVAPFPHAPFPHSPLPQQASNWASVYQMKFCTGARSLRTTVPTECRSQLGLAAAVRKLLRLAV